MLVPFNKEIPVIYESDVLVCGGGSAGVSCAIAAARLGVNVCLIERNNMLGGVMTSGGNNEIALFYKGEQQIIRGIGWEFVTRLEKMGHAKIPEFKNEIHHSLQGVRINIPMAGRLLDEMCMESGVKLIFGAKAVDVIKDDIWTVIIATDNGLRAIRAKKLVDCSGDGTLAAMAGAKYEIGDELQPATLRFFPDGYDIADINQSSIKDIYIEGLEKETLKESDFWPGMAGNPYVIFEQKGNNINHITVDSSCLDDKTNLEIEGRKSIERIVNWARNEVEGAGQLEAIATSCEVAIRETRRIVCDEYITVSDYLEAKTYSDSVCYAYYPVDLHKSSGESLENIFLKGNRIPSIPYSALIPKGIEDILVAGRCVSSDRLANSAIRVKAICMAMGQAAGTAVAISVADNVGLRDIDIDKLKNTLRENDCIIP